MNSPAPHPDSHRRRNFPGSDGVRHTKVAELVDDGYPDVTLGHLPVELAGEESIPQLLEPINHVFGKAAPVVAGGFLPTRSPFGLDLGQDRIPWMVVPPKHSTLAGRNRRPGFPLGNGGMGALGVVGAIRRDLSDQTVDLGQQIREDFAVVPVRRRYLNPDDVLGGFIDGQVNLAPGAAFADAVLADFPLAFPEYLQPCGVDHEMRGTYSRTAGYLDFQRCRPARHVDVVRHRQIQRAQAHQRFEQAFGRPVGQTEQGLERQAGLDCHVRVRFQLASAYRPRRRPILRNTLLVKPDGQVPRLTSARSYSAQFLTW